MQGPGADPWHYQGDLMQKKTVKKLVLAKETVRTLAEPEMKDVAGGSNTVGWTELSCTQPRTFCAAHPSVDFC
jgi:hypothetical protein